MHYASVKFEIVMKGVCNLCLLTFAYDCHPNYRLIVAANRDEYYQRPTEAAHFWTSYPWVLAGRDMEMLGTWMGITSTGRFAALTNYRDLSSQIMNAKSRGFLVSNFLCNNESPNEYMLDVVNNRTLYNGFNLLVGDSKRLLYFNKLSSLVEVLKPGIYGLSNHFLNTPWPKVQKSEEALANCLEKKPFLKPQCLFEILADTEQAQDRELPETGLSQERERMLSSIFIPGTDYGTRSSTVILIDRNNHVIFRERNFIKSQELLSEVNYEFNLI